MENQKALKWYQKKRYIIVFLITIIIISTSLFIGIAKGQIFDVKPCPDNIRAYEFGRTMSNYKFNMGNKKSLEECIVSYSRDFMMSPPFEAANPCVVKGFEDAENGIPSIYNTDKEKSWRNF